MDEDVWVNEEEDTTVNPELEQSEETEEEAQSPQRSKKQPSRKVVMNVALTKYLVVKKIAKHFKWKLGRKEEDENWDILWTDAAVQPEKLAKMKLFQKINHFPGMYALARKNYLAKNLNRIRKIYPKEYNFFPRTWLIPAEYSDLVMQYNGKKHKKVFIVKPEASCQGRGIFLTKKIDDFSLEDRYVVQEYLHRPFLIDNLKFDLRIYVLVAGCDPLRIFLHKEGLARFATESYIKPTSQNLSKQCMHLTNYAINKNNDNFIFNEDPKLDNVGHKRSLTSTMKLISDLGHDTAKLWEKIKDIIIKTLCAVQPSLAHTYKACQPDDPYNGMCFEILGFDIILDYKLKPWLLEVNHSPSFTTDSPLDWKIKFEVISEALKLLNIKPENRQNYNNKQKREILERSVTKVGNKNKDKKIQETTKAQEKREKWEEKHLGGYEKIFENNNIDKYLKFIQSSSDLWEEWTGGKNKIKKTDKKNPVTKPQTTDLKSAGNSIRQSKISSVQIQSKDTEKSIKILSVFDRLSQVQSKKPSIVDQGLFPCVKFEETAGQGQPLPLFVELNLNRHKVEKPTVQKLLRFNEIERKNVNPKDNVKYSDFPLLIQSVLGTEAPKNIVSNDKLVAKNRNLTPGYRKKPYQYATNLSYYKKWDINE
jgi:tubulin polyglutamylase TTLL6/13